MSAKVEDREIVTTAEVYVWTCGACGKEIVQQGQIDSVIYRMPSGNAPDGWVTVVDADEKEFFCSKRCAVGWLQG